MAKSTAKSPKRSSTTRQRKLNPNAAGIDLGATQHYVAVPEDRDAQSVQNFGTHTDDLFALADWLQSCSISTVAWGHVESDGDLIEGFGVSAEDISRTSEGTYSVIIEASMASNDSLIPSVTPMSTEFRTATVSAVNNNSFVVHTFGGLISGSGIKSNTDFYFTVTGR